MGKSTTLLQRLALVCIGTGLVVACRNELDRKDPAGDVQRTTRTVRQDLISDAQLYVGTSLGSKELVLTFDDGPGPQTVTGDLSSYLKSRTAPIHATFFVDGACIATPAPVLAPNKACAVPTPNVATILTQLTADGHLIANHTTTNRDLTTEVITVQLEKELSDTDALIAPYVPWNRRFFRAPNGSWSKFVHQTLAATPMNKYVGPIRWDIGGGPTDQTASATRGADRECWLLGYTTKRCGDLYLTETRATTKGIVLMHDPYGNTSNHDINNGTGNTVDLVKYIVPILESEGFTFKSLQEVPTIAAALPSCSASCLTCSGPAASDCSTCDTGMYLSGGACSTCTPCDAGFFQSDACTPTANTVCTMCDVSCAACSGTAASACLTCGTGKYFTASTSGGGTCSTCATCGPGFYEMAACNATTNTVCGACDPSCTTCSGPEAAACGSCPSGFFMNGGTCTACSACTAGSYQAAACSVDANAVCTLCSRGMFSDTDGAAACVACQPGSYASFVGATGCGECGTCDDDDACTVDACSTISGCTHELIAGCGSPIPPNGTSSGAAAPSNSSASSSSGSVEATASCSASRGDASASSAAVFGLLALASLRRRRHRLHCS